MSISPLPDLPIPRCCLLLSLLLLLWLPPPPMPPRCPLLPTSSPVMLGLRKRPCAHAQNGRRESPAHFFFSTPHMNIASRQEQMRVSSSQHQLHYDARTVPACKEPLRVPPAVAALPPALPCSRARRQGAPPETADRIPVVVLQDGSTPGPHEAQAKHAVTAGTPSRRAALLC